MSLGCVQSEWGDKLFKGDWKVTKAWSQLIYTHLHPQEGPPGQLCCLIQEKIFQTQKFFGIYEACRVKKMNAVE